MTDIEIVRLCAAAMGWVVEQRHPGLSECLQRRNANGTATVYNPLRDDAQCFALVKKFAVSLKAPTLHYNWRAGWYPSELAESTDPNRAICECVARMQQSKEQAK